MQPARIALTLNRLGEKYEIKGLDRNLWHLQLHLFHHTVSTQMINAGMAAHIIQRYLKRTLPEMPMNYAHLNDSTIKTEFAKFQAKIVDIVRKDYS